MHTHTEEVEEVNFKLSREQSRAFLRLTQPQFKDITRIVYGGQAGGGKSFLICMWLDFMCEQYPGTRYYLGRETLKDIKESVLLTYFDVKAITGNRAIYREHKSRITYPNGSEIFLLETFEYPSDPNFDSFGSREYTAGAIEEGINVSRRGADLLISRTRYKHQEYGLYPKQLITCNPGESWIKDEIVIPQLEGTPKRANTLFIRATLDSNPDKAFAKAYTQTLEDNLTAFDKARLLHGDWNAHPKTGAEYLKEFNQDVHIVKGLTYNPDLPIHLTFDENVNPYITCLVYQVEHKGFTREVSQIEEICMAPPRNSRKTVCEKFMKLYPLHTAGLYIYGDATSWHNATPKEEGDNFFTDICTFLTRYNPVVRVPGKNPPVVSKGGFLNLILEKEYCHIRLRVDSRCKKSIADFCYAVEDMNGGILKRRRIDPQTKISFEEHGHHIDALSYFVCEAFLPDFIYYLNGSREGYYHVGTDRREKFYRPFSGQKFQR